MEGDSRRELEAKRWPDLSCSKLPLSESRRGCGLKVAELQSVRHLQVRGGGTFQLSSIAAARSSRGFLNTTRFTPIHEACVGRIMMNGVDRLQ